MTRNSRTSWPRIQGGTPAVALPGRGGGGREDLRGEPECSDPHVHSDIGPDQNLHVVGRRLLAGPNSESELLDPT